MGFVTKSNVGFYLTILDIHGSTIFQYVQKSCSSCGSLLEVEAIIISTFR